MNATQLIRRLTRHRQWATHRLLDATRDLTDEQLHAMHPIGQGSIWKSLTHLLAAEYVWLEALEGNETPVLPGDMPRRLPGNQAGESPLRSFSELEDRWHELDERWSVYVDALDEASLGDLVYKTSTSSGAGQRFGTRRADILLHVCTHAQYTTAQVVNMLRHAGVEQLPDVMLISLARSE